MKPLVLRLAVATDVEEACRWYGRQCAGLGEEFLSAVQGALDIVLRNPEAHPVVHRDTRRILLRRFPYSFYFRVLEAEVVVVACFHVKRDPKMSRSRQ